MRAWRWPIVVLVPVLLVAGALATSHEDEADQAPGRAEVAVPTAAGAGSLGSTWYCAGGTATGAPTGVAEHVVAIANASQEPATARVTAYPDQGDPVTRDVAVGPLDRVDLRLSDLVTAPWAAALVEVTGSEVAVQQAVRGPTGRSVAPCASAPGPSWHFPRGTTRVGAQMVLALFNPFPTDAVVDITFDAEDGARAPQDYQGLVVPRGRVLPVDVSAVVTLRERLATTVSVRSGRIVADQLQVFSSDGPVGLSLVAGAPRAATAWLFPAGVAGAGELESIAVSNPTGQPAEVDVQVLLDDAATNGMAEPFQVTLAPGRAQVVDLLADGRVPVGVGHATVVRSRNGVPVVAERAIVGGQAAARPGVGYTMGAPVVATDWIAAIGAVSGSSGSQVTVFNPSAEEATVTVRGIGAGRSQVVPGGQVTLAPGERRAIDLGTDGVERRQLVLRVEADQPVVAEVAFSFAESADLADVLAAPVAGAVRAPAATVGVLGPAGPSGQAEG